MSDDPKPRPRRRRPPHAHPGRAATMRPWTPAQRAEYERWGMACGEYQPVSFAFADAHRRATLGALVALAWFRSRGRWPGWNRAWRQR